MVLWVYRTRFYGFIALGSMGFFALGSLDFRSRFLWVIRTRFYGFMALGFMDFRTRFYDIGSWFLGYSLSVLVSIFALGSRLRGFHSHLGLDFESLGLWGMGSQGFSICEAWVLVAWARRFS